MNTAISQADILYIPVQREYIFKIGEIEFLDSVVKTKSGLFRAQNKEGKQIWFIDPPIKLGEKIPNTPLYPKGLWGKTVSDIEVDNNIWHFTLNS